MGQKVSIQGCFGITKKSPSDKNEPKLNDNTSTTTTVGASIQTPKIEIQNDNQKIKETISIDKNQNVILSLDASAVDTINEAGIKIDLNSLNVDKSKDTAEIDLTLNSNDLKKSLTALDKLGVSLDKSISEELDPLVFRARR